MNKLTKGEKTTRDTGYLSEVPEGGIAEIRHKGKILVRREGKGELKKIGEE